jgi:hypothetical protein
MRNFCSIECGFDSWKVWRLVSYCCRCIEPLPARARAGSHGAGWACQVNGGRNSGLNRVMTNERARVAADCRPDRPPHWTRADCPKILHNFQRGSWVSRHGQSEAYAFWVGVQRIGAEYCRLSCGHDILVQAIARPRLSRFESLRV